jgi:N-acetylglucosamine-6-phosphate deacetylase
VTSLAARRCVLPSGPARAATVRVEGGRIVAVVDGRADPRADRVLEEGVLAPGLVDLQVNGAFGQDLAVAGPEGWDEVARGLASHGVTSFLATFTSAPLGELEERLRRARALVASHAGGPGAREPERGCLSRAPRARLLGAHLEGPFLSPARAGAHDPDVLRPPDPQDLARLLDAGGGALRLLTLAPELPGGIDAVAALARRGVVVSVGHSDATAGCVAEAVAAGASFITHLFNAQRGLSAREPGVTGYALVDERLRLGVVADGVHVVAPVLRLAWRLAAARIAIVSDAVGPAGARVGVAGNEGVLAGRRLRVSPGDAVARLDDGTLAGGLALLDDGVRTLVALGVPPADAWRAASVVPAAVLGHQELGRIAPGAAADLVWTDDELRVREVWVAGRPYQSPQPGAT